jgi:fructose-specific phosphotransferase system IIC component
MTQSRLHSIAEAVAGTAIGFVVSVAASMVVYHAHGHAFTLAENVSITLIFTVLSVVRGYLVRRLFNRFHKKGGQPA